MSTLLSPRLPGAASSVRSAHRFVSASASVSMSRFSTTTAVLSKPRSRTRRPNSNSNLKPKPRPTPPPSPPFERDSLPHVGRSPAATTSPRRQFDVNGGGGRGGTSGARAKGPLASVGAVASGRGRGTGVGMGGVGRNRDREGERESTGRAASPSSSFHRSVERASRESYRVARQLDGIKYDNAPSSSSSDQFSRSGANYNTNFHPNLHSNSPPSSTSGTGTGPIPSSNSSRSQTDNTFSEREDKPLTPGAYDTPELADEFFHPSAPVSSVSVPTSTLTSSKGKQRSASGSTNGIASNTNTSLPTPARFTNTPLLPGLVASLGEMLGPDARPTPIQALSLAHLFPSPAFGDKPAPAAWGQYLLASETGSGKSLAYLLPLVQRLKMAETPAPSLSSPSPSLASSPTLIPIPQPNQRNEPNQQKRRRHNPRALILAPTHELARQLAGAAKGLVRAAEDVKLRVLCASRANIANPSSSQSAYETEAGERDESGKERHPVDIVVGTPMKLLEMVRGRGFDALSPDELRAMEGEAMMQIERGQRTDAEKTPRKLRRGRDRVVHFGKWKKSGVPEMGLQDVEWVVVDEADVLFDPDFMETTRALLADISAARGVPLPASLSGLPSPSSTPSKLTPPSPTPVPAYPFHLILTTATIPKTLNRYLSTHHPGMLRLASPRLHRLPKTLQTEYVGWTGGNKFADVVRRVRQVWAEDAVSFGGLGSAVGGNVGGGGGKRGSVELSKVLVFCNRSAKVAELAAYLEEQGIKSVALTSTSAQRLRGSNAHLDGFLKATRSARGRGHTAESVPERGVSVASKNTGTNINTNDPKSHPHVLITTSLLSRGLDFAPDVRHVFVVDAPRNTVDFVHRAGRTARAGERGRVVIFGKMKGRGSAKTREVRRRVGALVRA